MLGKEQRRDPTFERVRLSAEIKGKLRKYSQEYFSSDIDSAERDQWGIVQTRDKELRTERQERRRALVDYAFRIIKQAQENGQLPKGFFPTVDAEADFVSKLITELVDEIIAARGRQ